MAGTNTEKPTGKAEKAKIVTPVKEKKAKSIPAEPKQKKETKAEEKPLEEKNSQKLEDKKETKAKTVEKKKAPKKEEVSVNVTNLPVSTKVGAAISKFIKNKEIRKAIDDLEQVTMLKKAVPMKGEIPHRKGKIMSGRFPERAASNFIKLLKNLQSNALQHDVENPIITLAVTNKGTTTYAKGGRARKKRSHVKIVARQKKVKEKNKK